MNRRMQVVGYLIGFSLVLPLGMLAAGCASGESAAHVNIDVSRIDKVAVVDVLGDIKGDTAKNQIADYFGMELLKRGFTPVERTQIQSLLKEHQFEAMDVTSPEGVVKAGKILNVSAVIVANVQYGEELAMTAKLIEVEDGRILWIGKGSGKTGKGLLTMFGVTTEAAAGATAAGGNTESKVAGGVGGAVLGGVGGEALTPQQSQMAGNVVAEMCKSMPSKVPVPTKK